MQLSEAMSILGVDNINDIDVNTLKKIWKGKIKNVHPDKARDESTKEEFHRKSIELNTAYELVLKIKNTVLTSGLARVTENGVDRKIYVITLNDLLDIYGGKVIQHGNVEIDIGFISNHNIIVQIDYKLTFNGDIKKNSVYIYKSKNDNFNIDIELVDDDFTKERRVILEVLDAKIEKDMSTQSMRLRLPFKFNVNVEVLIERISIDNG